MSGRSNGLGFFAGLNELLGRLRFNPCVMLGLQSGFLLVVCILCIFEDVNEMFTLSLVSRRKYEGWEGERTVLTTFPDLLIMVTVSMTGIL